MGEALEQLKPATREEILEWVRRRIAELEAELRVLKGILALVEGGGAGGARPGERVEDVKVGKRRVAALYRGEGYIRLVPSFPMPLPTDLREYLEKVVDEIAARQAREGVDEAERARLDVTETPDGAVAEIRVTGLHTTLDTLKARAALKFIAEMAWEVYKASQRRGSID